MPELWPEEVSRRIISRMLKKLDFTQKKDLWVSRKERTKETSIRKIKPGQIICCHMTGMDEGDDLDDYGDSLKGK